MASPYIERILKARVYDVAIESALDEAPRLSRRLGNKVLLKREDLQPVFSFKLRGAYNRIAHLADGAAKRGVVCASAGNHAQGVALAARRRGIPAAIVMPRTTPQIKVQAVIDLGGEVVLHGDDYDTALERALELARERNLVFVHPFDDPDVIAGQGTIGVELVRQTGGNLDAIFVPVGGGGLIAGIAVYVKYLYPNVRIIGVEPEDAASMYESLKAGRRVTLDRVGIFADGVAVKRVGEETFSLCRSLVDEIVLLDTDEICAAIQDVFEDTRSIVEPAGALAVAGLKKYVAREGWRDKRLVAINSGANINFDRLRHVAERADLGGEREALLAVTIPERPGSFLRFCEVLGNRNVTEFNYRYESEQAAQIFVSFGLAQGRTEKDAVIRALREAGYTVTDMTDNEMAKLHVRYMVGGHARGIREELLYRFEFPERPGALLRFLQAVGGRWNISLFHYRNHGSDYGRVLAGIQVPSAERADFLQHLNELHYAYAEETDNPAYRMFLGA
ncbi:MAG: threonine ammonia-lyase, biosynthetic [Gammaproteobacteria bacterium]|nr:threonine ammonia-lyase, biosynthetic [Gammaproteobacteria bacterium]MDE2261081.1 threonine ammonia-lyase, biosynthetic [Gammaproteobacteria bacterium]